MDSGNQKSSTSFDPAGWALDKMSRARKATAWSLANRSHESHSPGRQTKKSSTERGNTVTSCPADFIIFLCNHGLKSIERGNNVTSCPADFIIFSLLSWFEINRTFF